MLRMALPLLLALTGTAPARAGGAKVEDIARALEARDAQVRGEALLALRRLGPEAAPAVKGLLKALKHADAFTREQAAHTLAAIGPRAREAEAQLAAAVQDRDTTVCRAAAHALAALDAKSEDALEALRRALQDEDASVRRAAARALTDLAPGDEETVQALTAVALAGRGAAAKDAEGKKAKKVLPRLPRDAVGRDNETELRVQALRALAAIGPAAKGAATQLTPLLREAEEVLGIQFDKGKEVEKLMTVQTDPRLRLETIATLRAVGGDPKAFGKALRLALKDRDPRVRLRAAKALWKTESAGGAELVPVVLQALTTGDAEVRREAAEVIAAWNDRKEEPTDWNKGKVKAADLLRKLVEDKGESPAVRRAAAVALFKSLLPTAGNHDPHLVAATNYLTGALKDPDPAVRGESLAALAALGSVREDQIKFVRPGLKDPSPFVRRQALRWLGAIGAPAKDAIPELQPLLQDKDQPWGVKAEAAIALLRLSPEDEMAQKAAVDWLTRELRKPGDGERAALVGVVARTKDLPAALGKLLQDLAQNDPEPAVRRAAAGVKRE